MAALINPSPDVLDSDLKLYRYWNRVSGKTISAVLGAELVNKIFNHLIFRTSGAGANSTNLTAHGYDVAILIDICRAIVQAEASGSLLKSQAFLFMVLAYR